VEGLTIHRRLGIDPASADPSTQPVTHIDVALSEAVVRQLARGMDAAPETEAAATALETTATAGERAAATTVETDRDLLIKLTARRIGSVTGDPPRCPRRHPHGREIPRLARHARRARTGPVPILSAPSLISR
jgi:hypothetical protein